MKRILMGAAGLLLLLALLAACSQGKTPETPPESSSESQSVTDTDDATDTSFDGTDSESVSDTQTESDTVTESNTDETLDFGMPYYEYDGFIYFVDVADHLSYIEPRDDAYLVLANRQHPIGSSYEPASLKKTAANSAKKMETTACMALDAMFLEMEALGMADTIPQSTYRSYNTQVTVYNRYIGNERKRHPDLSEEEIIAIVDSYSARPGTSDHQTGLAVDFKPISEAFEKTDAFRYLTEHAHKFGFILRFPEDKTDITGYMYESWHWRFVGREAATEIHERGLTLEEYLDELYGGVLNSEAASNG